VTPGLFALGPRWEAPMVCGTPPSHPPEALDDVERWAGAGQPLELPVGSLFEPLSAQGSPRPGGVVEHEPHAGVLGRGIGPSEIPPVPSPPCLPTPWPCPGLLQLR